MAPTRRKNSQGISNWNPNWDRTRAESGGDYVYTDQDVLIATDFECGNGKHIRREGDGYALDLEPEPGEHRFGGMAYYYISSTTQQMAFMKPTETDRKVLAVYFNPVGTVDRVAQYGRKDGKIFDYVKRETPSQSRDQGLIGQILKGIGPVNPLANY